MVVTMEMQPHSSITPEPITPSERLDRLTAVLVDGAATERDWTEFRAFAGERYEAWRRLAEDFGAAARLSNSFFMAAQRATNVEIDFASVATAAAAEGSNAATAGNDVPKRGGGGITRWAQHYGGWAIAATLLLGWGLTSWQAGVIGGSERDRTQLAGNEGAGQGSIFGDEQAIPAEYAGLRDKLQPFIVDMKPAASGGYELVYVRPTLERTTVDRFYRLGQDEAGRPLLLPENEPKAIQATY